jgi:Zn-dependent protease with chaperone function
MPMSAVDEAMQALPGWVSWLLWLVPLYLASSGYVLTRVFTARAAGALPDSPWTERARQSFPVRMLARMIRLLHVAVALVAVSMSASAQVGRLPAARLLTTLVFAYGGALVAALPIDARIQREKRAAVVRSWFATTVLLFAPIHALLGFWALEVASAGATRIVIGITGFTVVTLLGLGFGSSLAELTGIARPARESLQGAVNRTAARLGVRCSRILELDSVFCNAFAFPLTRKIAFTVKAAEILDDSELEAVAAHELGHLDEPLVMRAFRPLLIVVVAFTLLIAPLCWTQTLERTGITLVTMLAIILVARRIARRAEQHADSYASDNGAAYVRALEKLSRQNLMPLVSTRPGPHGHTWDRMIAAGLAPSLPRPAPPRTPSFAVRFAVAFLTLLPLGLAGGLRSGHATPGEARLAIALGEVTPMAFEVLARTAANEERFDEAATFYRAAVALAPPNPFYGMALVITLGNGGHCEEARRELDALEALADPEDLTIRKSAELSIARCQQFFR